jgi:hypothetical protein
MKRKIFTLFSHLNNKSSWIRVVQDAMYNIKPKWQLGKAIL